MASDRPPLVTKSISKALGEIQAQYPRNARTPQRLAVLWVVTNRAAERAISLYKRRRKDLSTKDERYFDAEIVRFSSRMGTYRGWLEAAGKNPATPLEQHVTAGLLLRKVGGAPVPDCVWPLSFLNQLKAGVDTQREAWEALWGDLWRNLQELVVDPLVKTGQRVSWLVRILPWLAAVGATVVGGVIAHQLIRKMHAEEKSS